MQHLGSGNDRVRLRLRHAMFATLCASTILCQSAFADTSASVASPISTEQIKISSTTRRPTIALALGGGGMRGAAHIGVLRVLEREKIPIDYIVGTSMGSIVGGLYCAGVPLDSIEKLLLDGSFTKAYQPRPMAVQAMLQPFAWLKNLVVKKPLAGLYTGKSLSKFFNRTIPADKRNIEDLDIKFSAVATDLCAGESHIFSTGSLSDAIRASSTIPIAIRPVEIDGRYYVDGNLRTSVPAHVARRDGIDIVLGVQSDEQPCDRDKKCFQSYLPIFDQMVNVVQTQFGESDKANLDYLIWPHLKGIPLYSRDAKAARRAIAAGEEAAERAIPEIRKLMTSTIAKKNRPDIHI